MSDDLRARLTALVTEMRADADCAPYGEDPDATRLWADKLAALLREPPAAAPVPEPDHVESYRVEPDTTNPQADWHVLTFTSGRQVMIYTDRPLVIAEPEQH